MIAPAAQGVEIVGGGRVTYCDPASIEAHIAIRCLQLMLDQTPGGRIEISTEGPAIRASFYTPDLKPGYHGVGTTVLAALRELSNAVPDRRSRR